MKNLLLALLSVAFLMAAKPTPTPPPAGSKVVTIDCGTGQSASVGGIYGGQFISLGCERGKVSRQTIVTTDTVWSMRVGVETSSHAWDCAFNGDSETVAVDCVGTTVTVQ